METVRLVRLKIQHLGVKFPTSSNEVKKNRSVVEASASATVREMRNERETRLLESSVIVKRYVKEATGEAADVAYDNAEVGKVKIFSVWN